MDKVKTEGAIEEQKAEGVEPKESEPANEVEKHDILSVRQEESEVGIETDLVLPARDVTIAPRIEELDSDVENYRPADDASALEVVTGLQDWFSKDEHWGASKRFVGFAPTNKVTDPALLELHTRRAVLEAVAVTQAGDRQLLVRSWGAGGSKEDAIRTLGLGVEIEEEGAVKLVGDVKGVVEGLKNTEGVSPTSETIEPAEAKEIVQVCDQNWKEISLQDVQLKFAVCLVFVLFFNLPLSRRWLTYFIFSFATIYRPQSVSSNSPAIKSPMPSCCRSKQQVILCLSLLNPHLPGKFLRRFRSEAS